MRSWSGQRYWLVGASEGLGAALAQHLSRMGVSLILSARDEDRLNELGRALPGRAEVVPLDVTDADAVATAAERIGDIDGIVYLAGVYWPFGAKDWSVEKAIATADVNFTGAMRLVGAVMPGMVRRNRGHIVLTGSLSGYRGMPESAAYSASKAGVMALAESLYSDLRKTGVQVQLLNPGFIRTRLTARNDFRMPFLMEPEEAARICVEHMSGHAFKRSFPTLFSWVFRGSVALPDGIYYRLFG
ncbi:SDR family NAD(P)-dependent oxidoreductase [Puniceibacterium confluentis]|uniref:SDR family NAD(P)-dependent oxidoreductase n=1 Tax=Puniceibacterium confluentis TaxID=1958944 RepID=UPI0035617CE1